VLIWKVNPELCLHVSGRGWKDFTSLFPGFEVTGVV